MLDNLGIDPNRRTYARQATGNVLDQLVAALASRPRIIMQWHDTNSESLYCLNFRRLRPIHDLSRYTWQIRFARTNQAQRRSFPTRGLPQNLPQAPQVRCR